MTHVPFVFEALECEIARKIPVTLIRHVLPFPVCKSLLKSSCAYKSYDYPNTNPFGRRRGNGEGERVKNWKAQMFQI